MKMGTVGKGIYFEGNLLSMIDYLINELSRKQILDYSKTVIITIQSELYLTRRFTDFVLIIGNEIWTYFSCYVPMSLVRDQKFTGWRNRPSPTILS